MKLKSLKTTAAERKAREKESCKPCGPGSTDSYPYGTCIRLDKDALKKLGLNLASFKAKGRVSVTAVGYVKSIRFHEGESYDSNELEIQLTELGIEKDDKGSALDAVNEALKEVNS